MADFKIGDVVKLKSGGPLMTIHSVDEMGIYCVWFERNKYEGSTFEAETLEKVERGIGATSSRSG